MYSKNIYVIYLVVVTVNHMTAVSVDQWEQKSECTGFKS